MLGIVDAVNGFVWGVPAMVLIVGTGFYLSIILHFPQVRMLPLALRVFFRKLKRQAPDSEGVTGFQALCTALAATVGTGNIAGVAGAITIGGPGAIFWMWICAFLGMVTKFAEVVLAMRFREKASDGSYLGGPMYMIQNGMHRHWNWMAYLYSAFGVAAAFGVGNATQVDAVIGGMRSIANYLNWPYDNNQELIIGAILSVLLVIVLLGGAKRIANLAELLVPLASVAYITLCVGAIMCHVKELPAAITSILTGAFRPKAVTGGVIGSVFVSLRTGVSRGVFTNEAGMGTASIAHAAAQADHPVEQGLLGIVEVFLDTIVICTMTALVILTSSTAIPYGTDLGVVLTIRSFSCTYGGWIGIPITVFLCIFAFATMLGWGLYGMRCMQYLFGTSSWKVFAILQSMIVVLCSLLESHAVWAISETLNGFMSIPNLIALIALSPVLINISREYNIQMQRCIADDGGTHENINQCKPV